MHSHAFDLVIIGSGAGGGTMAHALAATGKRILLIERGGSVPSEPENWSPAAVWKELRYRTSERWVDQTGAEFQPYTHYNVGGNTKFWGSVLYRLRREDFGETRARRRRLARVADHLRGSRAVVRRRRAAVPRARRRPRGYHRAAARPVSVSAGAACRADAGRDRGARSARGCIPRRCPSGWSIRVCRTGVSCATPATRSRAASTARATPMCAACGRRGGRRDALDAGPGAPAAHVARRHTCRGRRGAARR